MINLDLRANPQRLAKGDAIRFHAEVIAAAAAQDGIASEIRSAAEVILSRGGLAS